MTHAACISRFGGPEVLQWSPTEVAAPAAHEVRIRQRAIGVNYADVYMRSGNHPAPLKFPATLGVEAAGVVEQVGSGVTGFAPGDRVAYFGALGAYAEERLVAAERLLKLPASLDERTAAATLLKGMVARYLCREAYAVRPDDTVLIHAAAGGVGSLLTQWCAALGATVIGTVGSEAKRQAAADNGCRHVIVNGVESLATRGAALTAGRKASVVFDPLGGNTTLESLDCLRPRGWLLIFGRTADYPRPIVPFEHLMQKGSLIVTMTQISDFVGSRASLEAALRDLAAAIEQGHLRPLIGQQYALRDVALAHRDLEARRTIGSTVLIA